MITFKPGQKIFPYETMGSDEAMLKASMKYRGQGFIVTMAGDEEIRGIWLKVIRGGTGTHYLNSIKLDFGEIRLETDPVFHNLWSYVALNEKEYGVTSLEIGTIKISEKKQRGLIKYLFERFEE